MLLVRENVAAARQTRCAPAVPSNLYQHRPGGAGVARAGAVWIRSITRRGAAPGDFFARTRTRTRTRFPFPSTRGESGGGEEGEGNRARARVRVRAKKS